MSFFKASEKPVHSSAGFDFENKVIPLLAEFKQLGEIHADQKWRENFRRSLLPIIEKPNLSNLHWIYVIHDALVQLAQKYPLNDFFCPIGRELIAPEDFVALSTGHEFNITNLMAHILLKQDWSNPLTNLPMNKLDKLYLLSKFCFINRVLDEPKLSDLLLKNYIELINKNNIYDIQFLCSHLAKDLDSLKHWCSIMLTRIARTKQAKNMELFELLFKEAQFNIDELHSYENQAPETLLSAAIIAGNYGIVEFLIKNNASTDFYTVNNRLRHPLFDAVYGEKLHQNNKKPPLAYKNICSLLLKSGAKADISIDGIPLEEYARTADYLSMHNPNLEYIKGSSVDHLNSPQCEALIQNALGANNSAHSFMHIFSFRY